MPDEYTPTTEEIRDYVEVDGEPQPWMPPDNAKDAARAAAFDRWLAAHDAEIRGDQAEKDKRLSETIRLLKHLPIQSGSSAKEPWVKFNLIDVSKAIEVAEGKTDPSEWVSVFCGRTIGTDGPTFDHSPHHWSEYREGEEPLRIAHYCDGITPSPEEPTDA